MPDFDSRAEAVKSKRNMTGWRTGGAQITSKSEAVQQAERESYQPWLALRNPVWIFVFSKD